MSRSPELTLTPNPEAEKPEYSPEDLENMAAASHAAEDILVSAIKDNRVNQRVTETDKGLRGIVEGRFSDGIVTGLFAGSELSEVHIEVDTSESGETHMIRIEHPESPPQQIFLDDQPANPQDLPGVYQFLEAIRAEREDEVPTSEIEAPEGSGKPIAETTESDKPGDGPYYKYDKAA